MRSMGLHAGAHRSDGVAGSSHVGAMGSLFINLLFWEARALLHVFHECFAYQNAAMSGEEEGGGSACAKD